MAGFSLAFFVWNRGAKITLQILVGVGLDFFTYSLKTNYEKMIIDTDYPFIK